MFIRIVKMTFQENTTEKFIDFFNIHKEQIRTFKGCQFLELYRDKDNPAIFFTYSHWQNLEDLENYRNSNLFKNVWTTTKQWFAAKPEAWSVDKLITLS